MFKKNIFESFVKKDIKREEAEEKNKDISYIEKKTEEKIFNLQEEKENLIDKMHVLLKDVDIKKEIIFDKESPDLISVGVDTGENKERIFKTFGKKSGEITAGDIAIASLWGKKLKLSPEIDRKTKKEFIIRETKRKIKDLWNKQLSLSVKDSMETNHINSIEGLESSSIYEENQEYHKMKPGHLAEKIFESFFTKLSVNNPDLPFEIEVGDVYDDAIKKIDFIFHIKKEYSRGLNIESCDDCDKNDIGIQYTMNEEATEKKENQILNQKKRNLELDDLVLVTVPLGNLNLALREWLNNKKTKDNFSGPERFLDENILEKLFKSVFEKLPNYLEIDSNDYWNKIKHQVIDKK